MPRETKRRRREDVEVDLVVVLRTTRPELATHVVDRVLDMGVLQDAINEYALTAHDADPHLRTRSVLVRSMTRPHARRGAR